jgi:hypothetical protein
VRPSREAKGVLRWWMGAEVVSGMVRRRSSGGSFIVDMVVVVVCDVLHSSKIRGAHASLSIPGVYDPLDMRDLDVA